MSDNERVLKAAALLAAARGHEHSDATLLIAGAQVQATLAVAEEIGKLRDSVLEGLGDGSHLDRANQSLRDVAGAIDMARVTR